MKLNYITTTCPYCGTGCGLNLVITDDGVAGVAPSQRSPVGRGKLCMRGLHSLKAAAENPVVAMINGEAADFDKAIAAADLKKYSGEDLAVITSRRLSNEAQKGIMELAKSLNAGIIGTFAAGENAFADIKVADIAKAGAVLVVGDCMRKLPLTGNQLFAVQSKGGKVFFAGEQCYTAVQADEAVFAAENGTLEIPETIIADLKAANDALVIYSPADKFAAAAKAAAEAAGVKAVPVYDTANGRGAAAAGFEPVLGKLEEKMPKAMLLFAETPLLDDDMYAAYIEKLQAVEFLVVVASNECSITDIANVVIPSGAFFEYDGTFTNWEGRTQLARKAAGEGKNIYDVITALSGGAVTIENVPEAAGCADGLFKEA